MPYNLCWRMRSICLLSRGSIEQIIDMSERGLAWEGNQINSQPLVLRQLFCRGLCAIGLIDAILADFGSIVHWSAFPTINQQLTMLVGILMWCSQQEESGTPGALATGQVTARAALRVLPDEVYGPAFHYLGDISVTGNGSAACRKRGRHVCHWPHYSNQHGRTRMLASELPASVYVFRSAKRVRIAATEAGVNQ